MASVCATVSAANAIAAMAGAVETAVGRALMATAPMPCRFLIQMPSCQNPVVVKTMVVVGVITTAMQMRLPNHNAKGLLPVADGGRVTVKIGATASRGLQYRPRGRLISPHLLLRMMAKGNKHRASALPKVS